MGLDLTFSGQLRGLSVVFGSTKIFSDIKCAIVKIVHQFVKVIIILGVSYIPLLPLNIYQRFIPHFTPFSFQKNDTENFKTYSKPYSTTARQISILQAIPPVSLPMFLRYYLPCVLFALLLLNGCSSWTHAQYPCYPQGNFLLHPL